jgi:hypothetical protein
MFKNYKIPFSRGKERNYEKSGIEIGRKQPASEKKPEKASQENGMPGFSAGIALCSGKGGIFR